MEDLGKEELYFMINRIRRNEENKEKRNWVDFVNNEYPRAEMVEYIDMAMELMKDITITELDKKREAAIDDLCIMMEEACDDGAGFFAIDHLHYFSFEGSGERLDLQIKNVMHRLNEIARRRNVPIFIVAHYKNTVPK